MFFGMNSSFDLSKPIAIGSDHAGYDMKEAIISLLEGEGLQYQDFGAHSSDAADYPDFAHPVAMAVEMGTVAFGILLCGSANGVSITANKHPGIRAAVCWGDEIASVARLHNDANVLCLPARFVSLQDAEEMVEVFISTPFEGGRHQHRVNKISFPSAVPHK
jgi:ribose 5-phosphate isomerase B